MHAGLDQHSRIKLMDSFNRKGGLMILIIMYDVGGQVINLHKHCHRVFIATQGISLAKVFQAIGRMVKNLRLTSGRQGKEVLRLN